MACTRLFIEGRVRKRLFMIFERDRPYEVTLTYRRFVPKTYGGTGLGFGSGSFHYVDVGQTSYTADFTKRLRTESEAIEFLNKIDKGDHCMDCEHINNCKFSKRMI